VSFRARLTLSAALAVALAIVLASAATYVVVRNQLRSSLDDALRERAVVISRLPPDRIFYSSPFPTVYAQLVAADGSCNGQGGDACGIPVTKSARAVARGGKGTYINDMNVESIHLRVLTFRYAPGYAVQVARPLSEFDRSLSRIRIYLLLTAATGIGLAALLGLLVARAALAPVRRLTEATETVTETGDLSERIDARGRDELSRLAGSFNSMLGALEEATRAQRQLVADASHELRTPLTSLRTNIEVLARDRELPEGERERLLNDVVEQLGEMWTLFAVLINLALV
jgi:two-component system sensor histidine kinase MprB